MNRSESVPPGGVAQVRLFPSGKGGAHPDTLAKPDVDQELGKVEMIRSSNSKPSQSSCRSRTHLHRDGRESSVFSADDAHTETSMNPIFIRNT